jgi:hypothetical protein
VNCERLERLAGLLERYRDCDAPRFDLQSWGKTETRRRGFLWSRQYVCNTKACAVGLACGSGIFAKDGLSYVTDKTTREITPIFHDHEGWSAVKAFFDLDQGQAVTLFAEHSYELTEGEEAAHAVAIRIRQMVAPIDEHRQEEHT